MGWGSAGEIFDRVARGLKRTNMSDEDKYAVLFDLGKALQNEDWDTEDESLEAFQDDPVIVRVFRDLGVTRNEDDD